MESLNTSITLSENPSKNPHPANLCVNTTSRYLYQKHHLSAKLHRSTLEHTVQTKDLQRSTSTDQEYSRTPLSSARSAQLISHTTIALNFANKTLTSLPKSVLDHSLSLLILDLSSNSLTEFPVEITSLSKLKSLKLDSNKIKKIPSNICALTCLESFSIASNYITSLPETIHTMASSLTLLNISQNRIDTLPLELSQLVNLKVLWIHKNFFISLPVQLASLNSLRELGLDWFKYTFPSLAVIQNDKNREVIKKTLGMLQEFAQYGKKEARFEDLVKALSIPGTDSIATKDPLRRSLYHIAALEEEIGIIRSLASTRREFIDDVDQNNQTPLLLAIREEKDIAAKALIISGANPSLGTGSFGSGLHIATARHRVGLVKDLLKYGANANAIDSEGNTPLHLLCSIFSKSIMAYREIGILLIGSGADPNILNYDGWSPTHLAIRRGQSECLKWILDINKKNESSGRKSFDLNIKGGGDRWTPLHLAAGLGHFEIIDMLTENNVDLVARTKTGKTARDAAANNIFVCKMLKRCENRWINSQLFNAPTLESKLKGFSLSSNVFNLKHMIHSSSTKALENNDPKASEENSERSYQAKPFSKVRPLSNNSKQKRSGNPVRAYLKLDDLGQNEPEPTEESSIIGDVDEVATTKETTRVMPRSPNNIQKIQIAQNYREHLLRLSVCKEPSVSRESTNMNSKSCQLQLHKPHKSGPAVLALESALPAKVSKPSPQMFIFPTDFQKYIKNFESYIEEIKAFQDLLLKEAEVPLSEKLKHIFYMQVLHMKINGTLGKIGSESIPIELFILCEHIEDERRKCNDTQKKTNILHNFDIIPRTLLFVFENLDSKKYMKNIIVRERISRLFSDFKYESARHFLQQLYQNIQESKFLRKRAKVAFDSINKDDMGMKIRGNSTLNNRGLASILVSPKQDDLIKSSINFQLSLAKPPAGLKLNKRTQSHVAFSKCEDIEDEEETHRIGQNDLKASLEKTPNIETIKIGMGFRAFQDPLPSKSEIGLSKNKAYNITKTTEEDRNFKNLEIQGIGRRIGASNYFGQD